MEDQSNSKSQEVKSFFPRRIEKYKNECEEIRSFSNKSFSILIDSENSSHKISADKASLKFSENQWNSLSNWINPVIKEYRDFSKTNLDHLESSRKSYTQFKKKLNQHLKSLSSNNSKGQKKNNDQLELLNAYFEDSQYRELYNVIHNFQSLPNFLLSLEVFKTYNVCQIFAHEKGQAFAQTSFYSQNNKSHISRIKTEEFNKLFQSIKKSKSKIFYQQSFPDTPIEAIGAFLASSFTGTKYNLILLIGRNDFLPPSDDEINIFSDVTRQLEPVLSAILRRSAQDDQISSFIEVLESFPHPISITDKSELCLFKNDAFDNLKDSDLNNLKCHEKELFGKNILRIYLNKESHEQTDLYHFYRVSLLGELLNTLRHELSNPLFGLSLAADMLTDDNLEEDIQETISDIKTNCERCQTIIKNFSSLYQDEEDYRSFNLIELLKETIILTKSETKGISKVVESDDELTIFSNPTWISQIVFNIIINSGQALASHYGDQLREAKISIKVETSGDLIFISVIDNGPGVNDEDIEKIFSPFYTTKDFGTGLGLSICKNLITKLDGELLYSHNQNGGAKFTISLPYERV